MDATIEPTTHSQLADALETILSSKPGVTCQAEGATIERLPDNKFRITYPDGRTQTYSLRGTIFSE